MELLIYFLRKIDVFDKIALHSNVDIFIHLHL